MLGQILARAVARYPGKAALITDQRTQSYASVVELVVNVCMKERASGFTCRTKPRGRLEDRSVLALSDHGAAAMRSG